MADVKEQLKTVQQGIAAFAKASPDLFGGFSRVTKAATGEGSFSTAQKELIAAAIAVSKGCEDCIVYHVDAAVRHGAGETELVEMLEIAVEMGGGPSVMYGAKALNAFRALKQG